MTPPACTPQLLARRRRVSRIRRRVVGMATATFLATTGGIFVQLVSGHDPALARTETKVAAATSTTASSPSSSSASSGATTSSSSSSGDTTAVTTSAS